MRREGIKNVDAEDNIIKGRKVDMAFRSDKLGVFIRKGGASKMA